MRAAHVSTPSVHVVPCCTSARTAGSSRGAAHPRTQQWLGQLARPLRGQCGSRIAVAQTAEQLPTTEEQLRQEQQLREVRLARKEARRREQLTYQFSAIAATAGVTALAAFATYYRIAWHLEQGDDFPYQELAATLALVAGGAIGMEAYARWAHRVLWHDNAWGWALHKSHHEPRVGPFEANDIFAIANALPAMLLCLYGFMRPDVTGGLCFGAGLGITTFGICYMFVHDGMVHKRFPVGPIADMPALKRIAAAHKLHHSEKYGGVPFGMFLGPQELEAVGASEDLERLVQESSANRAAKAAARADSP